MGARRASGSNVASWLHPDLLSISKVKSVIPPAPDIPSAMSAFAPISSASPPGADLPGGAPVRLLLMQWTAPTRRHLGAKMVVSMNHREIGAVHERSYHDRC